MNLFGESQPKERLPLAARLRPTNLDDLVGQEHLAGRGTPMRTAIESGALGSVILWGPPGSGKTTLARICSALADSSMIERSAVTCGVADIRAIGAAAKVAQNRTTLFLDEIHHFSRTQQDALLGLVEDGTITLIGATTENPLFSLGSPLLSRCRVLVLKPLTAEQISEIVQRGAAELSCRLDTEASARISQWSNGDARIALNAVEFAHQLAGGSGRITIELAAQAMGRPATRYDSAGDQHYDTISAFIKSVRGSDPDAALHYLARMLKAGEDLRFIARRLIILASEDIGNAAPNCLVIANAALQAVERIGLPEARIILAHATTYLAASPKSNASYLGIERAMADLDRTPPPPVPDQLRDKNTKRFGNAEASDNYDYPHDHGGWVNQEYVSARHDLQFPYYEPKDVGYEAKIKQFLEELVDLKE